MLLLQTEQWANPKHTPAVVSRHTHTQSYSIIYIISLTVRSVHQIFACVHSAQKLVVWKSSQMHVPLVFYQAIAP